MPWVSAAAAHDHHHPFMDRIDLLTCCFDIITGVAQLTTLTIKLALAPDSPAYQAFKWYYVLLPESCMLLLCWLGPLLRMYEDLTLYFISMALAWIPLAIINLLLVLRLDNIVAYTWETTRIIIPLWAVDVVVSSSNKDLGR